MKKLTQIFAILLPILMGACTSDGFDNPNVSDGNEVSVIEAIMTPFGDVQSESRTAIDMSDSKVNSLVWAEGDTIGIYPSAGGDQLSFPITDGIGTGTCIFTGGGWALKTSTDTETYKYTAYSPFNRNYYWLKDNTALPINMLGQKQNGNDNSKHLGAYHIQIASGDTPTSGKISFKFKHKVSFVRMDITAPCAATWKSIELESDAAFTTKAAMNLSLDVPTVTPTAQSNSVTLELENVKTTESDLSIVAYLMMLPVDFNDKTLTMYLTDIDGRVYSASVEIRNPNNAANPKLFGEATSRWISAEFKEIPYVTFTAAAEQTLTMSQEVQTLEYSVGGGKWASLGTKTVTFGGDKGDLRLRGQNAKGTADSRDNYSQVLFGNENLVTCSGDIRTLVDYEDYQYTNTGNARFCQLFKECKNLTSSPVLPATTLASGCYSGMFSGCSSLTEAPTLPATTLATSCYSYMFEDCSSLTEAPALPATTLAQDCYWYMFNGCSSLTEAPALPATTLALECYCYMFKNCGSLTEAPVLPATTLTNRCYEGMFQGCSNLTEAPVLSATTLAQDCYHSMFSGCLSLTLAPELPATVLADYCYHAMFYDCQSLTSAPTLPVTLLVKGCYDHMFRGCSKLNEVTMLATDINAQDCLANWLWGVSQTGTLIKAKNMNSLPIGPSGIPEGWNVVNDGEDTTENIPYITFTAEAEQTLTMSKAVETLEYSVNEGKWMTLGTTTVVFGGSNGNLRLRGKSAIGTAISFGDYSKFIFGNSTKVSCKGDIRTLVDYENYATANTKDARFCYLYSGCPITQAPELPATTLAESCYYYMFNECTQLTQAPELPATTLAESCYRGMFISCYALSEAPVLPATKLKRICYAEMFSFCKNLIKAPTLPATAIDELSYWCMFRGCSKMEQTPELPATTLAYGCYSAMFENCTSLVQAPMLPATDLHMRCYDNMFKGCSKLEKAPELPSTTLAEGCYDLMFKDCTSLTKAPVLPATTLKNECYESMFAGCSKLKEITMLATDITANNCLSNWVEGVSTTGTFIKSPQMTSLPTGASGIPLQWNLKDYTLNDETTLSFPITLVEGDNGELGILLYNYLRDKYNPNTSSIPNEIINIEINGSTGAFDIGKTTKVRLILTTDNYNHIYGKYPIASGIGFEVENWSGLNGFGLSETGECHYWSCERI